MTDLEKTKLCAVKMCLDSVQEYTGNITYLKSGGGGWPRVYDPLHDDAQAMRLMKKFNVSITCHQDDIGGYDYEARCGASQVFIAHDMNRALVECVAKLFTEQPQAA